MRQHGQAGLVCTIVRNTVQHCMSLPTNHSIQSGKVTSMWPPHNTYAKGIDPWGDPRGIQGGSNLKMGDPALSPYMNSAGSCETTVPLYNTQAFRKFCTVSLISFRDNLQIGRIVNCPNYPLAAVGYLIPAFIYIYI